MALPLPNTTAVQIVRLTKALYNAAPGNTFLTAFEDSVATDGITVFANWLAGTVSTDAATLASTVITNLGFTGTVATDLTTYLTAQLQANTGNYGQVILDGMNALALMGSDATVGTVATTLNDSVATAYAYSINTGNTTTNLATLQAADETAAATGQTFTLTTGVDNGTAFTGTSGDDTFIADNTGTDVTSTADVLAGGSGNDTLNVFSDGAAFSLPSTTSIETVNLYDQDASLNISTTPFADVTTLTATRGDGDLTFTLGDNVANVSLTDMVLVGDGAGGGPEGVIVAFDAAATTATLTLSAVTTTGGNTDEDVVVTGAALTTVNVNATGTASSVDELDLAAATTINLAADVDFTAGVLSTTGTATLTITGAGDVDLGTLDTGIDTVTASGNSGSLTAAIGAAVDTVLTGSTGNDVITTSTADAIATTDALAVDAGDGTADVLVVGDTADINTAADGARYDNFEIIRTADSRDMSLVAGITALQITGGAADTYSNISATQAADITFRANNTTSTTFTLASATGSTDAITINLASTVSTTNVDVVGLSVDNIETVNINATTGTNATDSDIAFLANMADEVAAINITGSADVKLTVIANTLDVIAVDIDASALTGTGNFTLAQTTDLVTGSTVTGSANADTMALGTTLGSTYDGGAGNDGFTGVQALFVADGSDDTVLTGGTGTDTLTLSDTTTTLTDNHFTWMTGMEVLALSNTVGDLSITTGSGFNTAFSAGATITTGAMAATKDVTLNAGLSNVGIDLTIDAATGAVVLTAVEVNSITTGSGVDSITFTGDAQTVGVTGAAAQGQILISTGAGADEVSVTVGTLLDNTGGGNGTDDNVAISITGGTGKDLITKVGTNGDGLYGTATFAVNSGDSTATAYDEITGFDIAALATFSDTLNFAGTAAVGTLATHVDSGTILSHTLTAGYASFDDAATYATALVIDSTNLADVVAYLAANTATNDCVGFLFDSDDSGTGDASMVYHNGATDSLVMLVGVTDTLTLVTVNASDAGKLCVA